MSNSLLLPWFPAKAIGELRHQEKVRAETGTVVIPVLFPVQPDVHTEPPGPEFRPATDHICEHRVWAWTNGGQRLGWTTEAYGRAWYRRAAKHLTGDQTLGCYDGNIVGKLSASGVIALHGRLCTITNEDYASFDEQVAMVVAETAKLGSFSLALFSRDKQGRFQDLVDDFNAEVRAFAKSLEPTYFARMKALNPE